MIKQLLLIGAGGFLGSVSRYLVARYIQSLILSSFPLGTLIVNLTGCLLIGVFYGLADKGNLMDANLRLFLTVGFCGGFTTFSSFANENLILLRNGDFFFMALYVSLSVFLGLLATWFGYLMIKTL